MEKLYIFIPEQKKFGIKPFPVQNIGLTLKVDCMIKPIVFSGIGTGAAGAATMYLCNCSKLKGGGIKFLAGGALLGTLSFVGGSPITMIGLLEVRDHRQKPQFFDKNTLRKQTVAVYMKASILGGVISQIALKLLGKSAYFPETLIISLASHAVGLYILQEFLNREP